MANDDLFERIVLEAEFECARDQGSTLVNPFLDFT